MDKNSLSVGQDINNFVETMPQSLRLDHEVPATENKENIQRNDVAGHRNNEPNDKGSAQIKTTKEAGPPAAAKTTFKVSTTSMPFRAYNVAEEIKKRKELRMQRLIEEEKKKRLHVANPMPNFKAIHSKELLKEPTQAVVLSPETPEVLKRGLAMKEKLKKKKEEYEAKQAERPPIVARSTSVLKKEPFEPKKTTHVTIAEPFALKMSERLKERKQYDDNRERELALQREKEQQEKEEKEARLRKLHRDNTVFKAKPNPFKKNIDKQLRD